MTYEVYNYISIGAAIACGVMLAVSVILFFTLRIPRVISDLSGRTAKRAIEDIRRQNEGAGSTGRRSYTMNLRKGKTTDKLEKSKRIQHPNTSRINGRSGPVAAGVSGPTGANPSAAGSERPVRQVFQGEATTILSGNEETTVLPENEMTTVLPEMDATVLLTEENATEVLSQADAAQMPPEDQNTELLQEGDATTVLAEPAETAVLYTPQPQQPANPETVFALEKEITLIHTSERIPQ